MPFYSPEGELNPTVDLRQVGKNSFKLLRGMSYKRPDTGETYDVPAHVLEDGTDTGGTTDLASVPWFVWNLIASFGRQTRPALLHDHLCVESEKEPAPGVVRGLAARKKADELFRVSLVDETVAKVRAWVMWSAVRVFGYKTHAKGRAVLLFAHLLATVASVYYAVWVASGHQRLHGAPWCLPLVVCVVLMAAWGEVAGVPLIASTALVFFLPMIVLQLVASLILYAGEGVGAVFIGGPPPDIGPQEEEADGPPDVG